MYNGARFLTYYAYRVLISVSIAEKEQLKLARKAFRIAGYFNTGETKNLFVKTGVWVSAFG